MWLGSVFILGRLDAPAVLSNQRLGALDKLLLKLGLKLTKQKPVRRILRQ